MSLTPGTRLGPYEIVSALGAGGMGEVYRARDAKLNRDVALKVLPDSFATDPDRLARFQREAQVLASLNHPNIAHVHGLEDSGGVRALVMELVEGEDLAQRLTRGAIPIDEALPIAKQIAEALDAAHEQGIIHRDLKPANIKLRADGTVKVLDFGLAKALETTGAVSANVSMSPTITTPAMTQAGIILGTAAYMSPEQARGKPVDRRTDIWAFGAVLFEMLTGRRAFEAEDVSLTLAEVMKSEPDWSALPPSVPPALRTCLRRCLVKDPRQRIRDIGDVRLAMEGAFDTEPAAGAQSIAPPVAPRLWIRGLAAFAATVVVAALAATAGWSFRPAASSAPVTRFLIPSPEGQTLTTSTRHMLAISPDGTQVAYVANNRLYVRTMSELEARPIAGTDGNGSVYDPVFSPDGRSIAFFATADSTIRKIAVSGGVTVTVCQASVPFGLSWSPDGITFGQGQQGIMRVAAGGGKPEMLVQVKAGQLADSPQMLPDGQTLLFTLAPAINQWDKAQVVVQSLKSGERKVLIEGGSDARYLPTGHLVYAFGGIVYAVPFDLRRLEVTAGPVPVIEGVRRTTGGTGAGQFGVSRTGSLVYLPGPITVSSNQSDLALFDPATGAATPLKLKSAAFEHPRVSPDGRRITFGTDDGREAIVWVYDLSGTSAMRQLTLGGRNKFPIWSSDGDRIAFQSDREGDLGIWWQRADGTGTAERLTKADQSASHIPESWLPRGDLFLYSVTKGSVTLYTFSIHDRKSTPFGDVQSVVPTNAMFSRDGRWVAYTSGVGSLGAVYVQPFPPTGTKYRVSPGTGLQPLWSRDGKELFFNPAAGQYAKASITTQPSFAFGDPVQMPRPFLTGGPAVVRQNDMTPDGKILGVALAGQTVAGALANIPLQVVLNWFTELQQRVPTR